MKRNTQGEGSQRERAMMGEHSAEQVNRGAAWSQEEADCFSSPYHSGGGKWQRQRSMGSSVREQEKGKTGVYALEDEDEVFS